jgi:hypothetical protein
MNNLKNVQYAWQQDSNKCGPACIEMLLRYYGLVPAGADSKSLQEAIAQLEDKKSKSNNEPNFTAGQWGDWVTTPIELIGIIRQIFLTKTFGLSNNNIGSNEVGIPTDHPLGKLSLSYFSSMSETDGDLNADNFMNHLAAHLNDPNQPPLIVPIHEASHWVVLHGIEVTGKKTTFIGKDPWQGYEYSKKQTSQSGSSKPSPDGTIRIARKKRNFNGKENQLIVMLTTDGLDGNFRTMGHAKSTPSSTSPIPQTLPTSPVVQPPKVPIAKPGKIVRPQPVTNPSAPVSISVSPTTLTDVIRQELVEYGFCSSDKAAEFMQSLSPPLLVNQTNQPNSDYFLVTQKNSAGEAIQIFRFDATPGEEYGKFLDALQTQPTRLSFEVNVTPVALKPVTLATGRVAMPSPVVKAETQVNNAPKLLWQPCREAQSPFFPYYEVIVENKPTYRRTDGFKFTNVTATSAAVKNDASSQPTT